MSKRMASFGIMFIQWLNSVRKEFKTLMTGSLLLTVMGLAQGLWQVPIPRWCYVVVSVGFLTWAFYHAWLKEHHIRQEAIKALEDRLQIAEAVATNLQSKLDKSRATEWKELAEQFQAVSSYLRADWQHGGMGVKNGEIIETWHITGLADAQARRQCEALCAFAGSLLIRSPKLSAQLTPQTLKQRNHVRRWLYFLKETHHAMSMNMAHGIVLGEGRDKVVLTGNIYNLGSVSATACLTCATSEL